MILQTNALGGEPTLDALAQVDREASVLEASKLMRKAGATELLVWVGVADRLRILRFFAVVEWHAVGLVILACHTCPTLKIHRTSSRLQQVDRNRSFSIG